jgi:hypothetical protein
MVVASFIQNKFKIAQQIKISCIKITYTSYS